MEQASLRIFVSLPMRDKFEDEICKEQQRLLELAGEYLNFPVTLINTYHTYGKYSPLECLGANIKRMAKADYVLFEDNISADRHERRGERMKRNFGAIKCLLHFDSP